MTQSTPPGWYPDGQGGQRWWDGEQWTDQTQPAGTSDRPAPDQPVQAPAPSDPTQVRPPADRPAPGEPEQPPAAAPTQMAGAGQDDLGETPAQSDQPDQQGWQPTPPTQGGGSGGLNTRLLAIIGGAAVLVLVVVVLLVVVLGGGGGGPKGTAEDYFKAIQDRDCGFIDMVSEDNREGLDKGDCEDDEDAFFGGDEETCADSDIEVTNEEEDGDKATVDYEVTGGGDDCEDKGTIKLVKEDGDWKIASFE
jgi:hypothetical protein